MIRKVKQKDLYPIIEIENISFKCPWPEIIFRSMLGDPGFILYEKNGEVLGYAAIAISDDYGHLANIAVHPEHRGEGIGTGLLQNCIEYAKENGANYMALEVRTKNSEAVDFYLNHGFKVIGLVPDYYVDDSAYVMEKYLG